MIILECRKCWVVEFRNGNYLYKGVEDEVDDSFSLVVDEVF